MSQKRTDFAFPRSLSPWKHALSLPNGRGAGTTVLGAPSNLKQARIIAACCSVLGDVLPFCIIRNSHRTGGRPTPNRARTRDMLRFVEEIILLLLRDDGGRFINVPRWSLDYALAGGVLMDLAMEDRIDTDLDGLVLLDATPTGDNLLDEALADIAGGREAHHTLLDRAHRRASSPRFTRRPSAGWWTSASWSVKTTGCSGCSAPGATRSWTARPTAR